MVWCYSMVSLHLKGFTEELSTGNLLVLCMGRDGPKLGKRQLKQRLQRGLCS